MSGSCASIAHTLEKDGAKSACSGTCLQNSKSILGFYAGQLQENGRCKSSATA